MNRSAFLLALLAAAQAGWAQSAPASAPAETRPAIVPEALRTAKALAAAALEAQARALPLGEGDTVGKVLSASPRFRWMLLVELRGLPLAGPPEPSPDGACRVSMRATMAQLAEILTRIDPAGQSRFARLTAPGGPAELAVSVAAKADPSLGEPTADAAKAARALRAAGVTADMLARAAERARENALAALAERIKDVRIDDAATLAQFVAAAEPDADFRQFLRGARDRGVRYHLDAPIAEAEVEQSLRTLYARVKSWAHVHKLPDAEIGKLRGLIVAARDAKVTQVGLAVPGAAHVPVDRPELLRLAGLVRRAPAWAGRSLIETADVQDKIDPEAKMVADEEAIRSAVRRARANLAARVAQLPASDKATIGQALGADTAGRAALLTAMRFTETFDPTGPPRHVTEVTVALPLIRVYRLLLARQRAEEPASQPASRPAAATGPVAPSSSS